MKKKSYSQSNLFIRSLLFSVYSVTTISLYSLLLTICFVLPLRVRQAMTRGFLYVYVDVLKFLCRIDYEIEGLSHIPTDRAVVVLSKHQSTWETFFLPTVFHNPAIILKRELLWVPFFGWGLAAGDPIAIDRGNKTSAMRQIIHKGKKCLAGGRSVLFFPEGTRVPYGQVGHYKLGGARLAVAANAPVVPVAHNAGAYWPRRRFIKQPGTIRVVIGPVIESVGRTPDEVMMLAREWIETTINNIGIEENA
ncbi:MAG TPA: lysophospholipid acyltransferase family protein [Gammaproteobacteria bacterium]|jgi:1-acyl-sn-glycerol-3-phosphate acyltransferase|nr:lysophospholipid acyltransferase family protein [Gammaproteobacteria bacterium]